MSTSVQKLFTPVELGSVSLKHRVIMAPLTRMRATAPPALAPQDINVKYYEQRASDGGLLITEATQISQQGQGYPLTPGIYSDEQVDGWKAVTSAVQRKNGQIFAQLWHVGRVSHESHQPDGGLPVAPSAIRCEYPAFSASFESVDSPVPHALEASEITRIIEDYVKAAKNAKAAGFDGIELHAGNGYLLDQFINDNSNIRTDKYGGSIENRARLTLEVLDALSTVFEPGKIGVRFSPSSTFNNMGDSSPKETFSHVISEADKKGLSYIHVIDPRIVNNEFEETMETDMTVDFWRKVAANGTSILAAGGLTPERAATYVESGDCEAAVFGRYFISNPDLPYRLMNGLDLTPYDRNTFYGGGEGGYIDYPFHSDDPSNNSKLWQPESLAV